MDTRDFRPGLSETEMVKPTRLLSCSLLFLSLFLSPSPCCSVSLIISLSLSYYFFLRFSLLLALSSCSIPFLCYLNLSFPPRAIVYSVLVVIPVHTQRKSLSLHMLRVSCDPMLGESMLQREGQSYRK